VIVFSKQLFGRMLANQLSSANGVFNPFRALFSVFGHPRRLLLFIFAAFLHGKLTGNSIFKFHHKKTIVFLPLWIYDIMAKVLWPLNYVINWAPSLQPKVHLWESDPELTPDVLMDHLSPESLRCVRSDILNKNSKTFDEKDLMQLFDSLPAASSSEMIGRTWNGHVLHSNSVLDVADYFLVKPLQALGFNWGKRYRTKHVGDPLLFRFLDVFYCPLPAWGNVSISEMDYRGKIQATMRYCHQPWNDYFRVLEDNEDTKVILGLWTARETCGGWFTLTLNESTPV